MPGSCYILRCPYNRRNVQKEELTTKPSFFKAPNASIFQQWKSVVPRGKRGFTPSDKICELHFKPSDVIHYYEHTLKDGSVFRLKRGYPCLAKNAIPSIFEQTSVTERLEELPTIADEYSQNSDSTTPSVSPEESLKDITPQITICNIEHLISRSPPKSTFELMVESLSTIKPPTPDWGISYVKERYPNVDYIMCAKWKSFVPERRLIIDNLLNVKTFLKDQEYPCSTTQITSIDDISILLGEINRIAICADFSDSNSSDCQLVIKDHNFQRKFCDKCGIRRKRESDSVRKRLKSKKMRKLLAKSLELSEKLWEQEDE